MTVESRRAAVERIFGDAERRGHPVDTNPFFREWVEEWVSGSIEVDELRRRYREHRRMIIEARRNERERRLAAMGVRPPPAGLIDTAAFAAAVEMDTVEVHVSARPPAVETEIAVHDRKDQPTLEELLNGLGWKPDESDEDDEE